MPAKAKAPKKLNAQTVDNADTRQQDAEASKGVSLGEYKVTDDGTLLVDSTIRGATPVPQKGTRQKRLTKAQRKALEDAGRTPP